VKTYGRKMKNETCIEVPHTVDGNEPKPVLIAPAEMI
jgi:hypothetical protein